MKWSIAVLFLCFLQQTFVTADNSLDTYSEETPAEPFLIVIPSDGGQLKAGLGASIAQILIAPTAIAQALVNQFGSNLQAVVGLLNTTHTALYVRQNETLNAQANLLANITAASAALLTNQTSALLTHLDTQKEIAQNVTKAVVQAATALINSTANLASDTVETTLTVAQMIMNATLEARLQRMNATSVARQRILNGIGTLLAQRLQSRQLFYGNLSMIIQDITNATASDLQSLSNTTLLTVQHFDNMTNIAMDALGGVMAALTDATNTSSVAFVEHTTVLLDTIADIVNTTLNISATTFANHTQNLLETVGDVFGILANASAVRQEAFVNNFNTSVIAFTDALVDIRESAALFAANVTANFADQVADLLEASAALHTNVTRDLGYLLANRTEALSRLVSNVTAIHNIPVATTRNANDNLWFVMLGDFMQGINQGFQSAINQTAEAFQAGVQGIQQGIAAAGQNAEALATSINVQLNSTLQQFNCAQRLIPEYIRTFVTNAIEPVRCSQQALSQALNTAMTKLEKLRLESDARVQAVIDEFFACRNAMDKDLQKCTGPLIANASAATLQSTQNLGTYLAMDLPNAFLTAQCEVPETSSNSFAALEQQVQGCLATAA